MFYFCTYRKVCYENINILTLLLVLTIILCSCGANESVDSDIETSNIEETQLAEIEQARKYVIEEFKNDVDSLSNTKNIENYYKKYYDDDVISNIYFYCIAKQQYGHYVSLGDEKYLDLAIEYALRIDPDYSGEFSDEMHEFVLEIVPTDNLEQEHNEIIVKEDKYNSLTNSDKKEICKYIKDRYSYYDNINGGYAGDKYSDVIMQEAADKYGLTVKQIEIIYMNSYSY